MLSSKASRVLCLTGASLALVACGGGSSGSGGFLAKTGVFMEGQVENLRYESASRSAVTNSEGEFLYLEGETINFYVGDILIGSATAAATLDLFDLAGTTPPTSGVEVQRESFAAEEGSSFGRVINTAVFLQTLDADDDLSNGTQIPDEMHTLAESMTIDFAQSSYDFEDDFTLRQLIAAGRDAGLWGGVKEILYPGLALDNLYSDLGLTADIYLREGLESDTNNDGTAELTRSFSFDENNVQYVIEEDSDANGSIDESETFNHDANSNLILLTSVVGLDTFYEDYSYDANGRKTAFEEDDDGDGMSDTVFTYEYDANGSLTSEDVDSDGDGVLNYTRAYTYDENGNRTMQETDSGADGSVNQRITYTYDANNFLTLEEWDNNVDGVIDITYTYTRDADGNLTLREWDQDGDGVADDIRSYEYDADGNEVLFESDTDGDGSPEFIRTSEYDADGNRTLIEQDNDGNGTIDVRRAYTYDADGLLTLYETDSNGDGTTDDIRSYTYDDNGNLTLFERDTDADGAVDEATRYTYSTVRGSWNAYWIIEVE